MKKILVVSLILFLLTGCSTVIINENVSNSNEVMTIEVIINDDINNKELFSGKVSVNKVDTLEQFLNEQEAFEIEISNGSFGKQISSVMGIKQDFKKGPWWLYESENNKQCVENGMCDGISNLKIEDGDKFTFKYTDTFE